MVQLKLTSNNGYNVSAYLFDDNGTTILGNITTAGTNSFNTDGLAAGTYYVQVNSYYNTQFEPYTLTDSVFAPAQANDKEPDSSRATALTLPLNSTTTGHIGYYYNNHRDSLDWYKITTTGDGLVQLKLTSNNGYNVSAYLFDNNGTTILGNITTAGTSYLSTDGLAAGIYYVQVNSYYNTQFEPYTLTDSLFLPAQANDKEPDSSRATALTLPLNSTTTGHVGYYYNNHRDSLDWYKITVNTDGMLQLKLTSGNGNNISVYLFDNNGTTILNNLTTVGSTSVYTDGLAAGTYYVQVNSYYNTQFEPYTLTDSLFTYTYAANTAAEPNGAPYQAKTLLANRNTTGHTNFYYNLQRDSTDWWKINYTGTSGNLNLTYYQEPNISTGGTQNITFQVYSDTSAAPISNITTAGTNYLVSLTGLAQGYYYIRVASYYNTQFEAYSIADSFIQVNKALISIKSTGVVNACSSDITYNLSGSHSPYTVRLYKNGILYDSVIATYDSVTATSATATFNNLSTGNYYATVYGDGATGTAYSTSATTQFLPPYPTILSTSGITTTTATLHWNTVSCADSYIVEYRKLGTTTWTTSGVITIDSLMLTGLTMATSYEWAVRSSVTLDALTFTGSYSHADTFTTATQLPVTFVSFDGIMQNNNAVLSWKTADEINNKGFQVERSADAANFNSIGFVNAQYGHTELDYNFTDKNIGSATYYYRLKQIDLDGNFAYSKVIKLGASVFSWSVNGNPVVNNNSYLQLVLNHTATVSFQVISLNGSVLQTIHKGSLNAGNYTMPLTLGNVSAGTYIVKLIVDKQSYTTRVIKP